MEPQAPVPPPPQPPQPPPAAPPEKKKKMGALGWVLIGCGGIVLLGTVLAVAGGMFVFNKAKDVVERIEENPVRAAAEAVVWANPELELVEADDAAETLTIRNTKTGEVATFDWSEIREGRFKWEADGETMTVDATGAGEGRVVTMTDSEGRQTASLGGDADLPEWFPAYPRASEPTSTFSTTSGDTRTETFGFTSDATVGELIEWYERELTDEGFELSKTTYSQAGVEGGSLSGESEDGSRSVSVVFQETDEGTQVGVNYTERG